MPFFLVVMECTGIEKNTSQRLEVATMKAVYIKLCLSAGASFSPCSAHSAAFRSLLSASIIVDELSAFKPLTRADSPLESSLAIPFCNLRIVDSKTALLTIDALESRFVWNNEKRRTQHIEVCTNIRNRNIMQLKRFGKIFKFGMSRIRFFSTVKNVS